MAPLIVTVYGQSELYHRAERAVMSISVTSSGPSQEQSSQDVTSTASSIQSTLRALSPKDATGVATADAAITHWTMKTLSTSFHDNSTTNTRVYRATTSFEIKFANFEKLGEVASTFSTTPNVAINSINWHLLDSTRKSLETQGRKLSVQNAMGKARDFVDAFPGGEGKVLAPSELKDEKNVSVTSSHGRVMGSRGDGVGGGGGDGMTFASEDIKLVNNITVKFLVEMD
ncbi:hypothetical protein B0J14DRAFT_492192 [Halenospora varia]|nr:hypothetical protein B0J14DRAFT_492192 [Halenospora varia]